MTNVLKNPLFDNPARDLNQMLTGFWEAAGTVYFQKSYRYFQIKHHDENILVQLRDELKCTENIRKDTSGKYILTFSQKIFLTIMESISGNLRDPKKLVTFNNIVKKTNTLFGTDFSLQKHIVKGVPHPSWLSAYESTGKTFLDVSMHKKTEWFDTWFCGFYSGDGHVTIYSDKTKVKWKSRVQLTQKERAPLQKIQSHYQRGRIYFTREKKSFKHELQFNTHADKLFFLNEVIYPFGHCLDDTLKNHQVFAKTFNAVHAPLKVFFPETLRQGPLLPWFVTGITDADGCFHARLVKRGNQTQLVMFFSIGQKDELHFKQKCVCFFGVGSFNKRVFHVRGRENLRSVVQHFDMYPLQSWKRESYLLWRQVWEAYCAGEHRTEEGFKRLAVLCKKINKHTDSEAFLS